MRPVVTLTLCALVAGGCRSGEPRSIRKLVGEVHIHEFPGGVHPAALFVASPVAADSIDGDSLVARSRTVREGHCVATSSSDPLLPAPHVVDGGALRILGGSGIGRVELAFHDESGYLPVGELPRAELFKARERLTIEADGAAAPAFRGSLEPPSHLELIAPTKLTLPPGDFTVRWRPDRAERIELALVASKTDGRWVVIRCRAEDAAGELTFPRSLLARLPPAPRDLQLEVTRNQIVRVATALAGTGVILHASFARKLDGHEDR